MTDHREPVLNVCIARAHLVRCVSCLAFPLVGVAVYLFLAASKGHDLSSFIGAVQDGTIPAFSPIAFILGTVAWVVITWPKALLALKHRKCVVEVREDRVWLYADYMQRDNVASFAVIRRLFDFQLLFVGKDGREMRRSITLLRPAPPAILADLQLVLR